MGKSYRLTACKRIVARLLAFVIASFAVMTSNAQKMSVASFGPDVSDQTAMLGPTIKLDPNGEKCALIKIVTTERGFQFDTGMLGVVETEEQNEAHPGEIWLYVPNGVKRINIQHSQFGVIKDYDLGQRLKQGRTYVMELTSDMVYNLVVNYDNEKSLDVDVYPANAKFRLNGVEKELDDNGKASLQLAFGKYRYRVEADYYHPEESDLTIDDKENRQRLSVRLKPAFGYLNVQTPESDGGEVYVDEKRAGSIPLSEYPLKSGEHKITVYKKLYKPYTTNIVMKDSAAVDLTPDFEPNYADYDIQVSGDSDAQIFIDGECAGAGKWNGRLETGHHIVEAKKKNHRTVREELDVERYVSRRVSLSRPMPIYGTLEITTSPGGAEVYIDGSSRAAGVTAYSDSHLIIGQHRVKIVLPGHKTEEFDVEIKEGEPQRIHRDLTDMCNAVIYSKPVADIWLDGEAMGRTPLSLNQEAGESRVVIKARGYTTYDKRVKLDGNTKDMTIKLRRNYTQPDEFYIQGGYNFSGMKSVNVGLGFYGRNVNFEGNYIISLENSEEIYWSNGTDIPLKASYKPASGNVKMGYGIRLNRRMRLTPQAGVAFLTLKETFEDDGVSDGIANKAKAVSLDLGLRLSVAVASCVGISVTPEYLVGAGKSDGFKALSEISPKIKGYAEGFRCNVSLNLFF
ncbi:MAG: PEGA domain-containing protein [Paramuribaculum sp.]|nr:PEGA domain-containing protein [Paramuribaculum sp.]